MDKLMKKWRAKIGNTWHNLGLGDKISLRNWPEGLAEIVKINGDGTANVSIEEMEIAIISSDIDSIKKKKPKEEEVFEIPPEALELDIEYEVDSKMTSILKAKSEEPMTIGKKKKKKNRKVYSKADYFSIPPFALEQVAKVFGQISNSKDQLNLVEEKVDISSLLSAAQHHQVQYRKGYETDRDGQHHLAKAIVSLMLALNNSITTDGKSSNSAFRGTEENN